VLVPFNQSDIEKKELADVKSRGEQCNRSTGVAWADGSSWNKVTRELQRQGFKVVAAQIPMTSLSDDVTALRRALCSQDGPVLQMAEASGGRTHRRHR
jgi:hypothetical protein